MMKEEYLHSSTLEKSVDELMADLTARNYRPKPWRLHPGKAALLVLDMQNYFLDPASHAFTPSAPAILPNIKKLILMARRLNMEIIFTKHVNDTSNAGRMDKWWKDTDQRKGVLRRRLSGAGKQGGGEAGTRRWGKVTRRWGQGI